MCVAATAKRRRRQAKMGFKHLAIHGPNKPRPIMKHHSKEYYANKLTSLVSKQKQMALNKAKSRGGS